MPTSNCENNFYLLMCSLISWYLPVFKSLSFCSLELILLYSLNILFSNCSRSFFCFSLSSNLIYFSFWVPYILIFLLFNYQSSVLNLTISYSFFDASNLLPPLRILIEGCFKFKRSIYFINFSGFYIFVLKLFYHGLQSRWRGG